MTLTTGAATALIISVLMVDSACAQRVCRQDCIGPICTEKCTEVGTVVIEGPSTDGRVYRERDGDFVIDQRRRHVTPGIEPRGRSLDGEIK